MKTKSRSPLGVCCFLFLTITACEAKESPDPTVTAAPSPFPVLDSGVWAVWDNSISPGIYWIDNHRVLFKTVKDNVKGRGSSGPFNLSIWDTATNKVTSYTEYASSLTVCYREGYLHYALADEPYYVQEKHWRHFAGPLGKEKPFTPPTGKDVIYNELSCKYQVNPELAALRKTRGIRLLLDRHGYLDLGPMREYTTSKAFITLYTPKSKKGIEVSIPAQHAEIIRYYEFKGAYLVRDFSNMGKRFWWLYPDGKDQEVTLPVALSPNPTSQGLVTGWGKFKSNRDPGTVGLYLWVDSKPPANLIIGHAQEVLVSPNGCKLAFAHYPYVDATQIKDPGRITLKMINLCMEENTHGQ